MIYPPTVQETPVRRWARPSEPASRTVLVRAAVAGLVSAFMLSGWLLAGAAGLLMLGLVNPDGFMASHNVDRYAQDRHFQLSYLDVLSADAVPALDRLPEPQRSCALKTIAADLADPESWTSFNYARHRGRDILARHPVGTCP